MTDVSGHTISVESDQIIVRHVGRLTIELVEASRLEVARLVAEKNLFLILLDFSLGTTALSTGDIYDLCMTQGSVLPVRTVVAVVYRPGQFPVEDANFAETVSWNRGTMLRAFTDFGAAQQWLSEMAEQVYGPAGDDRDASSGDGSDGRA